MMKLSHVFALVAALVASSQGLSHEVRPALLQLLEVSPERYQVSWKRPINAGRTLDLDVRFPAHCMKQGGELSQVAASAIVSRWRLHCDGQGLVQHAIEVEGLSATLTDVLIRIEWLDGSKQSSVLRSDIPRLVIDKKGFGGLLDYLQLGAFHLFTGADHLLFILGLLYLGKNGWSLVKIVTSFTLAHSITLALSALDLVRLPQSAVEAVIALSILYLAFELASVSRPGVLHQRPWLIAFVFGLLHGFGFASALMEIGLPEEALWLSLLLFNLGVEVGQLAVVGLVLLFTATLRRLPVALPRLVKIAPVWILGCLSAYWVIDRSVQIFVT